MKYLITGILFFSTSLAWALPTRKYYINTPQGPVQVVTPQTLKAMEKNKEKQMDGAGVEFFGEVKVSQGVVSAYVRGCNYVKLGDTKDETLEPEDLQRLQSLHTGDRIKLKMTTYGGCTVADWKK